MTALRPKKYRPHAPRTVNLVDTAALKHRRLELGMTLRDLADASGRTIGTIVKYENGETQPPVDIFLTIAAFLEVEPMDLIQNGRG